MSNKIVGNHIIIVLFIIYNTRTRLSYYNELMIMNELNNYHIYFNSLIKINCRLSELQTIFLSSNLYDSIITSNQVYV
jgi:hypothetical protein